jgi:hypothetical protein
MVHNSQWPCSSFAFSCWTTVITTLESTIKLPWFKTKTFNGFIVTLFNVLSHKSTFLCLFNTLWTYFGCLLYCWQQLARFCPSSASNMCSVKAYLCKLYYLSMRSHEKIAGIVTILWAGWSRAWFKVEARGFSPLQNNQTGSPSWGSFRVDKATKASSRPLTTI